MACAFFTSHSPATGTWRPVSRVLPAMMDVTMSWYSVPGWPS